MRKLEKGKRYLVQKGNSHSLEEWRVFEESSRAYKVERVDSNKPSYLDWILKSDIFEIDVYVTGTYTIIEELEEQETLF